MGTLPFSVANLQGVGTRPRQEDSFAFVNALNAEQYAERGMLFCVCDGMGGMTGGALASQIAVQRLREDYLSFDSGSDLNLQLRQSLTLASEQIAGRLGGNGGTTAVAGVIRREALYFACAGDSYLFLLRNGKLLRLNVIHNICHTIYLEAIRNGCLTPAVGRLHPESAALTSFLGVTGFPLLIDSPAQPLPLQHGDVLLACSDGVGDVLSEEELTAALQAPSAQQMCDEMERLIAEKAAPYQDNYTALVIGYD